jgi:hypothetical protein
MKIQVNGQNNICKAVSYGLEGSICNYIVKMIKIPNTDKRFTYSFMNIFKIIDQYRVDPCSTADGDELDSRAEDIKNTVVDGLKPRKSSHNSNTDSYTSIESTTRFYSKKHY